MRRKIVSLLLITVLIVIILVAVQSIQQRDRINNSNMDSGDYSLSLQHDNLDRTYLLHVPSGYKPSERYPLVLVFHGGEGTGEKVSKQTDFNIYADQERFFVVYPDGIKNSWNDGRNTTDAAKLGIDDIDFVRELVLHLQTTFNIDEKRIYATGVSNGGIFSQRIGCEMSDIFAAIGPVVSSIATNITAACNPSEPISVVAIQGTEDPFIPIEGGDTSHRMLGIGDGGFVESAENT